jgi:hypothetical protein
VTALLALLALSSVEGLAAGDVYVDNAAGNDANNGKTPRTAFRTLKRAVEALRPRDVLRLAQNAEPYREVLVLDREGVVVEGNGATITGLDPVDPASFRLRSPGLIIGRLQPPRPQAQVHVDGEPLEYESQIEDIEPGQQVWEGQTVFVALPEGKRWPGPDIALLARTEGLVIRAPGVVVRNLFVDRIGGPGVLVSGASRGVRLEDVDVRFCRWGDSPALRVNDTAEVQAKGCRFVGNASGVVALHRTGVSFAASRIEGNRHFGVRVSGADFLFEDCRFRDNGSFDLSVRSLDPESANGGGPSRARAVRCLFGGALTLEGGEPPARLEVEACVFLGGSLSRGGGTFLLRRNLYGATKFAVDGQDLDLAAWRLETGDDGSLWETSVPADRPWSVDGRPAGPAR